MRIKSLTQTSNKKILILGAWFLVLSLATTLRLRDLAWVQIGYDELISLKLALDVLQGQWPAHAAYSGSVANHPPVYIYVMALGYLISKDFLWAVAYHALLDIASVALTFYAGWRYFGARVGFVAALLYAVAPWPIEFARHTWLTPQPIFTSIMLLGLLSITHPNLGHKYGIVLLGWGFTGLIGSHLSGIYFLPVIVLALWMGRRQINPFTLLCAFAPLIIIALAYLNFDRSQDFKNISALFTASGVANRPARFDLDAFKFALANTGGWHLSDITGEQFGEWVAQMPTWLAWIDIAQIGLVTLSLIICTWLAFRRRSATIVLILLTWLLPVSLQLRHVIPLGPAYFIAHVPAAFLLVGIAIDAVQCKVQSSRWQMAGVRWQVASGKWQVAGGKGSDIFALCPCYLLLATCHLLLCTIWAWHVFTWVRFNDFVQRYDTTSGGYGIPAYSVYQATRAARQATPDNAWVVFVTQEPPSPYNLQTVLANVMLADVPHRIMHPADGLILRQSALPYVLAPDAFGYANDLSARWQMSPLAQSHHPLRNLPQPNDKNTGYTFVNLPAYTPNSPAIAKFSNGIELLKADLTRQPKQMRVDLTLRVTQAPPPNTQFQWFNHLLSANTDRMIGQTDGSGIKTAIWRPGDVLRQSFDINLPADAPPPPYQLRLGSYLLNGPRLQITLADGQTDDKIEVREVN